MTIEFPITKKTPTDAEKLAQLEQENAELRRKLQDAKLSLRLLSGTLRRIVEGL